MSAIQRGLAAFLFLGYAAVSAPPARATIAVDLELVLAVDISLSMDFDELKLQRGGYVAAFRDGELHQLIARGPYKRIAVTYFEWAGPGIHKLIADWTLIDGAEAAHRFADGLESAPISRERMTSISSALGYAEKLLDASGFSAPRRVIDVSGDGPNNQGYYVNVVRDRLVSKGLVINGLPIMLKTGGTFDLPNLDEYYADCVIGGPGAFAIPIKSLNEMQPAIKRKLLLEIAGYEPPARFLRTQAGASTPRVDCTIGERLWRRYMDGRFPN